MKCLRTLAVLGLLFLFTGFCSEANALAPDEPIASRFAQINGVKLHYLTAGHGTPLLLLHGYAETSLMLQQSSHLAFLLQWTHSRSPGATPRAHILRLFLE